MSLGQTNVAGGNTDELEVRVDGLETTTTSLTSNMYELNDRMNDIEVATKKWYVNFNIPPASGGNLLADDGQYFYYYSSTGSKGVDYNIVVNGTSIASATSGTRKGLTSSSTISVENGTPISVTFSGTLAAFSPSLYKINIYKYGTLVYSKQRDTGSTSATFTYTCELQINRNTKIFRSTGFGDSSGGEADSTIDIYIEQYTP